ncbi:site-specific integrase [Carnobacteriaceae bacterium zg-ZUI240]|nr:site-specific integrase [Carnobacteriaceae bacterium zg-ZUI240]
MPAIKESNNTWTARFYYTNAFGKRVQKKKRGFLKKSDALTFERHFINQQSGKQEVNFAFLVADYLQKCDKKLKDSTLYKKKIIINTHIMPYFKKYNISDITTKIIADWQMYVYDTNNLSESYLRSINLELSSIFTFAEKYYNLQRNPVKIADKMGKATRKELNIWTPEHLEELNRILYDTKFEKYILPLNLLFWTGMRVGELMALQINDINGNVISVRKTLNYKREITTPKTHKSNRDIIIDEKTATELHNYISKIYQQNPKSMLFEFHKMRLNVALNTAIKKSNILPKIRVHDLRHSHASFLIQQGFSPIIISNRLGHEKTSTTLDIYGHLYPNQQNGIATAIQNFRK